MEYNQMTLEQLEQIISDYLFRVTNNKGKTENFMYINHVSRALIQVLKRIKGKCYLASLKQDNDTILHKYTGQDIANHQYDIAIPCYDLLLLIYIFLLRNTTEKNVRDHITNIIYKRTHAIGGYYLNWA